MDQHEIEATAFTQLLLDQRATRMKGGIYHFTQIEMAFNSNRIEGSQLTIDQTKTLYETQTIDGFAHANGIMPFVVLDYDKAFYYRGLQQFDVEPGFLIEAFRKFQDLYYEKYKDLVPLNRKADSLVENRPSDAGTPSGTRTLDPQIKSLLL